MSQSLYIINIVGIVIPLLSGGITRTSQYSLDIMDSVILLVAASLLVSTIAIFVVFYKRIKLAGEKYEEAKGIVGDVILSYNKQLGKQEATLEKVRYKVEGLDARSEEITQKVEALENHKDVLSPKLTDLTNKQEALLKDLKTIKSELNELKNVQENFEKQINAAPEVKIETAIPIRRERALEPLTETELRVLEFIATEGEKTAPEIRALTKLTREHSARLVKKLYEEGYLERDTVRTPYKYRVKDEMLKILRKSEANTQM
jgi:DNA repair exonuclease SbcCD ATPase subunit